MVGVITGLFSGSRRPNWALAVSVGARSSHNHLVGRFKTCCYLQTYPLAMQIRKAVITAAAPSQARLPLQSVVDRHGSVRTALELLLDDISGNTEIEEMAVVICPGMSETYRQATGHYSQRVVFIEQEHPRGYGDALLRARRFVDDLPFLHLVSDHLYVSRNGQSCVQQLIEVARREQCAVSAIQATRENQLGFFGAIGGSPVPRQPGLYQVNAVLEKPTPTVAEQRLVVAGQRAGHYLCLFGMHVLPPDLFDILQDNLQRAAKGSNINLSTALSQLADSKRYLAAELKGERYNIGEKYGLLIAQLAIALAGEERDNVLTELVELLTRT
jgi:UTP--glucose-1-phosphate uridylyltransferase